MLFPFIFSSCLFCFEFDGSFSVHFWEVSFPFL
uniref:Uncharacterized protein n=1 Tax=Rhizophora mucronata TaxID=61149 RepID=A0A2P2P6V3_RHIMU